MQTLWIVQKRIFWVLLVSRTVVVQTQKELNNQWKGVWGVLVPAASFLEGEVVVVIALNYSFALMD
jgi:hypothetical protein